MTSVAVPVSAAAAPSPPAEAPFDDDAPPQPASEIPSKAASSHPPSRRPATRRLIHLLLFKIANLPAVPPQAPAYAAKRTAALADCRRLDQMYTNIGSAFSLFSMTQLSLSLNK